MKPIETDKLTRFQDMSSSMSFEQFFKQIVNDKEKENLTWDQITFMCNLFYNLNYSESTYRKEKRADLIEPSAEQIPSLFEKINKERIKLHDENIQARAYIRKIAREETYKDIALEAVNKMSCKKQLEVYPLIKEKSDTEGILCLSDWHFGIQCENAWNKYDEEIARQRITKLRDVTIEKGLRDNIKTLRVLNLGDMIAGRIHLTIRLESRYDVITQIMKVSELLCELLNDLSKYFNIEYYSCTDNHSRLDPNKDDAMESETLTRITDWYIEARLPRIHVNKNKFGNDIITFKCLEHNVLAIHGEKDRVETVIDSISRMTEDHYDLICMAHRHHFSCEEKNRTVVVANSSLMGTDTYAKNLRLSAHPSQNLISVTKENVTEAIYRIIL